LSDAHGWVVDGVRRPRVVAMRWQTPLGGENITLVSSTSSSSEVGLFVNHPIIQWFKTRRRSEKAVKRLRKFFATVRFITGLSRFSESYFTVKGAALILPQSECPRTVTRGTHGAGDIRSHLQKMFYLLRPQDTIKVAVKLESSYGHLDRYMVVVSTMGRQDTEESLILGVDIVDNMASIGMVLAIWGDTAINLDGDGGFKVISNEINHIFKPVSVQAMWSALQSLIKVRDTALHNSYFPQGLTHTWVTYYEVRIKSEQVYVNEWHMMEDIESHRPEQLTE
jgi:hypothetical protein